MSISFTATVVMTDIYEDYDDKKVTFDNQLAEMDLGNLRVLRSICPLVNGCIEECGKVSLGIFEALAWLAPFQHAQARAAFRYIHSIAQDCPDNKGCQTTIDITWA